MSKDQEVAEFNIQDLLPIGLTLIVLVVGIAVGLDIVSDVQADFVADNTAADCNATSSIYTGCGGAYNATADGVVGITKITSKLPIIGTAIAFAVILGILVRYLFVRMS